MGISLAPVPTNDPAAPPAIKPKTTAPIATQQAPIGLAPSAGGTSAPAATPTKDQLEKSLPMTPPASTSGALGLARMTPPASMTGGSMSPAPAMTSAQIQANPPRQGSIANMPGSIDLGGGNFGYAPGKAPVEYSTAAGGAATPQIGLAQSAPAPMSTGAPLPTEYQKPDRLQLATQAFDTFAKSTAPQYTADLREATQRAAGQGTMGSGGLRTTYGNLANQRALALDTQRDSLINAATTASIGDSQANRGLDISQQNANTAERSALGSLDVAKGQLGLAKEGQDASINQNQQQIDLAKKQADINAAYQAGTLTLAQRNQALAELQNTQQYGLEGEKLSLAKEGQAASIGQNQQQIDLQRKALDIEAQYKEGSLTLAQRNQALAELQNSQSFGLETSKLGLAKEALTEQQAARLQQGAQFDASLAQSSDQFKASLAQNATQFGLSLDQQKALAQLSDATANRSIDVSRAQGQNQLLIQLASILGGPTGALNPDALAAIAAGFGIIINKKDVPRVDDRPVGKVGGGGVGGGDGSDVILPN